MCCDFGAEELTLKSHNVSSVKKSPSPESIILVYPPSKVNPSLIIGPYFFKNFVLLSTIILILLIVSSLASIVLSSLYAIGPALKQTS